MESLNRADGILFGVTSKSHQGASSFPLNGRFIDCQCCSQGRTQCRLVLFKVSGARSIAGCSSLQKTMFVIVLTLEGKSILDGLFGREEGGVLLNWLPNAIVI